MAEGGSVECGAALFQNCVCLAALYFYKDRESACLS